MKRTGLRWVALIACVASMMLSGCATVGGGDGDAERINNAVSIDDVAFVRGAVQAGRLTPDARVSTPGYPDGAPLIAIAARAAALEVLRFLVSVGADLNARTPVGETPLMLASFFFDEDKAGTAGAFDRHEKAARLLVDAGADLENLPGHYTPLAYAAYQGNERMVAYLLGKGARVDSGASQGGTSVNTPLMMAAIQGHDRIVRALLRAGANADVRVYGGHTAAEFAAKYNHGALARVIQCAQKQYGVAAFGPQCRELLGYDPRERHTSR